MVILKSDQLQIRAETDLVRVRQAVRAWAIELRFSLVDQTKMVTAASELGRNTLIYGKGGTATMEVLEEGGRAGLKVVFADEGPGIADVAQAMTDGFTTGTGLGLGLSGSKRLVNEFELDTAPGRGTRVTITRWR
jgi:serine/threonine-protein kinase RsbT